MWSHTLYSNWEFYVKRHVYITFCFKLNARHYIWQYRVQCNEKHYILIEILHFALELIAVALIVFGVTYVLRVQYKFADVSIFWLWWGRVLHQYRNRYSEVPAKRYSTKNTNQNTSHREFLPNSLKTEYLPNHQNLVPAKRCSTKNTSQNTNHWVPVLVTYQYQPDS